MRLRLRECPKGIQSVQTPSQRATTLPLRSTTRWAAFGSLLFLAALPKPALAGPAVATFPVSPSANARYLRDALGAPFPILGRTAWFITSISQADHRVFLDDSAAKGHTAIEFHAVNHDPRGNNAPFGGNGALPFLKRLDGGNWTGALTYGNIDAEAPDFTTPNAAYWTLVDDILDYAASKGQLAFMFPAYVGYAGGDQGYMQELVANGPAKIHAYGAFIAGRYASRGNIVWMMGGDMGTFTSEQNAVEQALLDGLKSVAGQQSTLFSAEWSSESIATDQVPFGSAMSLNGAYSWSGDVSNQGRRGYAFVPVEPAFLLEEPYDEEGPDGNGYNPSATQPVRRFQWWGWLSAVGGYISGNGYVWLFTPGWQGHLDTQGAKDMARLDVFAGSIAWQDLVPSGLGGMGTIVTAGGGSVSSPDYVAAAATPDGKLLVGYVPPAHSGTITLAMTTLSGPSRARWFNPTTAAYTDIADNLPNTGTHVFTPPGDNGTGSSDWVIVLDVQSTPVELLSFKVE
jgi:hypothetical protein